MSEEAGSSSESGSVRRVHDQIQYSRSVGNRICKRVSTLRDFRSIPDKIAVRVRIVGIRPVVDLLVEIRKLVLIGIGIPWIGLIQE